MTTRTAQTNPDLDALRIARSEQHPARARTSIPKWIISFLVSVCLVAAAYAVYSRTVGKSPTVETVMVQSTRTGESGVLLTGSGYIVTRHKYITIGTKILGQIVEEPIEEGQHVKKGDLLARIDDRDYQAQLRQAKAACSLAEANDRLNSARVARSRDLFTKGIISKDEFDAAVNAAEVAAAQVKRDEAALDYAKFMVDQCLVTAPINGIVLKKYRELGDTINYGGQLQAGGGATDIAQLADTEDMRAEVDINEADIAKVNIGSPISVVPDSYGDRHFDASVVKIYPEADRQKGTVKVEVHIENPDLQILKPEMSVKVSFLARRPTSREEPKFVVPKTAVKTEGGEAFVWLIRNGTAKRAPVQKGLETENGIEVKQGLHDGDTLIVTPETQIKDGQKVSIATGTHAVAR
jgi:RND family efflux transporter MFP subunit